MAELFLPLCVRPQSRLQRRDVVVFVLTAEAGTFLSLVEIRANERSCFAATVPILASVRIAC